MRLNGCGPGESGFQAVAGINRKHSEKPADSGFFVERQPQLLEVATPI
jgi:hypothetical protein